MKKYILLIALIYSSIISHSQNKTIDIENGRVIKTKSGYSIFGVINDVFTVGWPTAHIIYYTKNK